MTKFLKDNAMTLALLAGVAVGATCGIVFGDGVNCVKPVGDIFLNFVFTLVVPIVFFSISSSLCKMNNSGTAGKVLGYTAVAFSVTSIIAGIVAFLVCMVFPPLGEIDPAAMAGSMFDLSTASKPDTATAVVSAFTVDDFWKLFSKSNLLPMIIFAVILGFSVSLCGEKGKPFAQFLESGCEAMLKIMKLVMYVAPIGLGCFIANVIASVGPQILNGYVRVYFLYWIITLILFFFGHTLYVFLFTGMKGVKTYWSNIMPPALVAFATTSSIAALPANIEATKKMGVSANVADAVLPLGVNIHKDGSMTSTVVKVLFLTILCGGCTNSMETAMSAMFIAALSSIVMGAVPNGGVTGELLTCSLMGFDPKMAGIIIVIGTIVDMPATMLNSASNSACAMIVDTLIYKKKRVLSSGK